MRTRKRRDSKKAPARHNLATQRDTASDPVSENTASLADLQAQLQKPGTTLQNFAALPTYSTQQPASPLQAKASGGKMQSVMRAIAQTPSRPGQPLPQPVQRKMEGAFGADFSDVRIHQGSQAKNIGAIAYTQGSNIHFQPGQYNPHNPNGQKLLGHELTHVLQQRVGRVSTPQAKGLPINRDSALESEADQLGAKAAQGQPVQVPGIRRNQVAPKTKQPTIQQKATRKLIATKHISQRVVQLKTANLPPLEAQFVSRSSSSAIKPKIGKWRIFSLGNKTEKLKHQVDKYNSFKIDGNLNQEQNSEKPQEEGQEAKYQKQLDVLSKVVEVSENWLKKYKEKSSKEQEKDDFAEFDAQKAKAIKDIQDAAMNEAFVVAQQKTMSKRKTQGTASNILDKANDMGVPTASGIVGIANPITEQITGMAATSHIADAAKGVVMKSGPADPSKARNIIERFKDISDAASNDGKNDAVQAINNNASQLASWVGAISSLGLPLGTLALNYFTKYRPAQKDYHALKTQMLSLESQVSTKEGKANLDLLETLDAIYYAYLKVKRRSADALYAVISSAIDLVTTIASIFGGPVALAAKLTIDSAKGILQGIKTAFFKIKGLVKYIQKTRGENRSKYAGVIVNKAMSGNANSLQLLIDLGIDPSKVIKGWSIKLKTPDLVKKFLDAVKDDPGRIGALQQQIAEKFKSQA
jgi:hypothetical protein